MAESNILWQIHKSAITQSVNPEIPTIVGWNMPTELHRHLVLHTAPVIPNTTSALAGHATALGSRYTVATGS
jgi:hypothetical protein